MDFSPAIAQSLEFILKYEGADLSEVLSCTFSVDVESYGKNAVVELVPGGASILVTQENKRDYVNLYMDWLFEKSVGPLFEAFKKGFYKLYSGEFMTNCDPEELQLLICGSPLLDFHELEKITKYDGGYNKQTPVIMYAECSIIFIETSGALFTNLNSIRKRDFCSLQLEVIERQ